MLASHSTTKRDRAGRVAVATGLTIDNACGIPDSVVDADPRIISHFMTDISFNSPAAAAIRSNNR